MKKTHIVGIAIIAVAIAIIVSTYGNSSTYASFAEAKETSKELHVVSHLVKEKPQYYDPIKDANYFSFYAKDNNGNECKVVFFGTKPQDFEKSEQIVLTGGMVGNEFHASKILMKCPSKYTDQEGEMKEFTSKKTTASL
ncbi:cytochrome c maturation protein CcmE domain-containing protein [Solitalea canadensis]|uniref:Cytochrome c-type biogenesis protein CcmE n=1 Tax=Solitalea canadensis (strain ATCC 29591 / DSM 3403 / JCM 21819 / LMG 8368 / NBRC 15130 / NCIMB 12057 / USAM 9D) TaxID=929556 RepID=H8KV09_SOLCM|nr:cytochrome c maturation protein CcmE [Solitalea canadensis]AFD06009.1 cytochrome c-type biogenesis protein CcmE [Solitalea canadensis DSM 3403]